MAKEKSFLEQRVATRIAEKKEQRASNTEAYVQELTPKQPVMSPNSIPQSGKELRSRAIEGSNKAVAKSTDKVASAVTAGEKANALREFHRTRDEAGRFVSTRNATEKTNTSLKTLNAVFKDQTERIISTLIKNHKEQMKAMGNGGGRGGSGGLLDLLGLGDGPDKGKKPVPSTLRGKARRLSRVVKLGVARGSRAVSSAMGSLANVGSRTAVALEQRGGVLSKLPAAGRAIAGTVKNGVTSVAEYGSKALSSAKGYSGRALSTAGEALAPAKSFVGKSASAVMDSLSTAKSFVGKSASAVADSVAGSGMGRVMGSTSKFLGAAAAPALGAYEAYGAVTDDTKTTAQKAVGVSTAAGGVAGGLAGAQLGGLALGAMTGGNPIAAAVGGIAGGIAGYIGGEEFVKSVGTSVSEAASGSAVGELLGKGVALAMTPFSEDARFAVKKDWAENMASLDKSMAPLALSAVTLQETLKDYSEGVAKASGQIVAGVSGAASTLWSSVKAAGGQAVEAYKSGGVAGAVKALPSAASTVVQGASKAGSQVSDAVKLAGSTLGAVSEKYESGGLGVKTVSTGAGDNGGVSYGKYQLATNNKSMATFLGSKEGAPVAEQLKGLAPGSKEFNDKYKEITSSAEGAKSMDDAQHGYIQRTHFEPQAAKLKKSLGMDVSKESKAVQEAVWSTSVQYGPNSGIIDKALAGKDLATMSSKDKINAIQDYKAANVDTNFKKSSAGVKASVAKRIESEKKTLLAVDDAAKPTESATTKVAVAPDTAKAPKVASAVSTSAPPNATKVAGNVPKTSVNLSTVEPSAVKAKSAQPVSVTAGTSSPTGTASSDFVSASPLPAAMVAPNTPIEAQAVKVMNPPPVQVASAAPVSTGGSRGSSTQPTLDEVPLQITDMGLVLLQIGHI